MELLGPLLAQTTEAGLPQSVGKNAPAATRTLGGRTYYFRSEGCAIAFNEDPHRYLAEQWRTVGPACPRENFVQT